MNKKRTNILIHILIWIGVIAAPYIVSYFAGVRTPELSMRFVFSPLSMIIPFYLNYFFVIPKFLFKKKYWSFLAINFAFLVLMIIIMHNFRPGGRERVLDTFRNIMPLIMNIGSQILIIGLSVAVKMTKKWNDASQKLRELEAINTKSELQQLKSQLNPHFLFNSLNNVYALIAFDQDKAQLALHNLCDMLRYQLYEANREMIPLEKEIEFVRNYCDLMLLRLSKNVEVKVDLPEECGYLSIAPMLLVSIVENAFKHGVSQNKPSLIEIAVKVGDNKIICTVNNTNHAKSKTDKSGSGIGNENLKRRLELLYPSKYIFRTEGAGDMFLTQLIIEE